MRIQKGQLFGCLPALDARRFFQRERNSQFTRGILNEQFPALSEAQVQETWDYFIRCGYIEVDREWDGQTWYRTTSKGNTLAGASAAQPIKRLTAEKRLEEFMQRVAEVNKNDEYAFIIRRVALFGSMLTDVREVNDIDLALELSPRLADKDAARRHEQQRIRLALNQGRRFSNIISELYWPRQEVRLFLKARSRVYSLHEMQELRELGLRDFKMLLGDYPDF